MDFADKIAALSERIAKQKDSIETEEATKNAFIMPFISALGYDVFNPHEVVPEFTADVGLKKGEKVDYAIKIDSKVVMLFECKPCKEGLSSQHMSQLFRYFSVVDARFGILTNGIKYWFFTDLDNKNKMDSRPFFEFDILDYRSAQIEELKKFSIKNFDEATILGTASDLKYGSLLMREIVNEIDSPSEEVMRMLISRVYEGKLTASVLAKFGPLVQKAMKDTVRELVNQRLTSAIDDSTRTAIVEPPSEASSQATPEADEIITTQEEIDGYQIIRAILREVVRVDRIAMRDSKSYCAILLDDNNRKPICRLHFNRSVKYIGLFDREKNEERVRIENLDEIFIHAERLKGTIRSYEHANQVETT
jgi:predicted type IV restriction endonuclease